MRRTRSQGEQPATPNKNDPKKQKSPAKGKQSTSSTHVGPPSTPTKSANAKHKSPAKRKQSSSGTEAPPKSPRKYKAQPDPPSSDMDIEEEGLSLLQSPCKGCNFTGVSLRKHLGKRPDCKASYDVGELIELEVEAKIIKKKRMARK